MTVLEHLIGKQRTQIGQINTDLFNEIENIVFYQ